MRLRLLAGVVGCILLSETLVVAAPQVPDTVVWEEGIEYTNPDDQHLQLNLARPKTGDGPFPAVICIHGGGFRAGKRDGYDALCVKLAERGYVAATISYRLYDRINGHESHGQQFHLTYSFRRTCIRREQGRNGGKSFDL